MAKEMIPMPPHCDTMDGPVVKAAKQALAAGEVSVILPWAPPEAEGELTAAFKKTLAIRTLGVDAQELADRWFFETAVRLHRAGEGEPYTGLKPAGLDEGPVIPRAETAIEEDNTAALIAFLTGAVEEEIGKRFARVRAERTYDPHDVAAARKYVHATLDLMVYANKLHGFIRHGGGGEGHAH
jgi:hypothetical protein